jgi:hypothetical protein
MYVKLPKESLLAGARILDSALVPDGFLFILRDEGHSSGGHFAWGEYVRDDRRLELQYRHSLGLVAYHASGRRASHESYMRELGVWKECQYPGFSQDEFQVFHALAHDLAFARDFVAGDAGTLLAAAQRETMANVVWSEHLQASYAGDTSTVDRMRALFKEGRYADVVTLFDKLDSPHLLSDAQLRLIQIARERIG